MSRHRWFRAAWSLGMRDMAQRLKSRQFVEGSSNGFVIDRVRDNFLEARYIERIEYLDKIIDPFGKELTYERVIFNQCEFRASSDLPCLELLNAPRKVQGLVGSLIEVNNFSLAISPLSISVMDWAVAFQALVKINMTVESLQIGGLELAEGIVAKVVIKGEEDVRDASINLTHEKRHIIEKIQLRFRGPEQGKVILTNAGSSQVDVPQGEPIIAALRETVFHLHSNKPQPQV